MVDDIARSLRSVSSRFDGNGDHACLCFTHEPRRMTLARCVLRIKRITGTELADLTGPNAHFQSALQNCLADTPTQ